jgi:hypothetical protein
MASKVEIPYCLNEQQLMMLRLFKKPLPESDLQELRRLAVKLLSFRLDDVTEAWEQGESITHPDYAQSSKEDFRS